MRHRVFDLIEPTDGVGGVHENMISGDDVTG